MAEALKMIFRSIVWGLMLIISALVRGLNKIERALNRFQRNTVLADPAKFGLCYSPVQFLSRDGLLLRGWWFETREDLPVVILLHGVQANRAEPASRVFGITRDLIKSGYSVLVFDFRGHGESEGKYISGGYLEKQDLLGAIDYLRGRGVTGKIGVLGFSMGAAISLMTAAECKDIAAVIANSSFTDIISIIKTKLSKYLPEFFISAILSIIRIFSHVDFAKIRPLESARLISVPVLLIHGGKDEIIPVEHAYNLMNACQNFPNNLWIVPEARHTYAYFARPEEYINRILLFFKKALSQPDINIGHVTVTK